jgi:hypothetical protein
MLRPSLAQLSTPAALLCAAAALVIGLMPEAPRVTAPAAPSFRAWSAPPVEVRAARVDAPRVERAPAPLIGQSGKGKKKKQPKLKPAVLVIVTDFDKVDVTVNGLAYPEFVPEGEQRGMVLPAGGPHMVIARAGDKSKVYEIGLNAYETRYIVIEPNTLGNGVIPATPPPAPPSTVKRGPEPEPIIDPNSNVGKVTVYSKPGGEIIVDDKPVGQKAPYTVDVDEGRHELQVRYETGELSEKKIVRARKGSRIKLFFRQADK